MNFLIERYLDHLHKAYEAERKEDYEARKYHIDMAGSIIRIAAKAETKI